MDYQPLHTNRVDPQQYDPSIVHRNIEINVLIVDKLRGGLFPIAYQYKFDVHYSDNSFGQLDPHSLHFDSESFLNLGEIRSMHKNNRVIILRDGTTIAYNHLIITSSKKSTSQITLTSFEEFAAAYCTLIEAVKTAEKIPSQNLRSSPREVKNFSSKKIKIKHIESLLPLKLREKLYAKLATQELSQVTTTTGKTLFEIQV